MTVPFSTSLAGQRQRGATLLVGLLFLVILTLLGLSAALINKTDERMARNSRDRNTAHFAAESALRDARNDIFRPDSRIQGATGATATCGSGNYKGLCLPASGTNRPVWEIYLDNTAHSVGYGEKTNLASEQKFRLVPDRGGVSAQPRYVIEVLPDLDGESLSVGVKKWLFRISALGYGANPGTRVMLQEVIKP